MKKINFYIAINLVLIFNLYSSDSRTIYRCNIPSAQYESIIEYIEETFCCDLNYLANNAQTQKDRIHKRLEEKVATDNRCAIIGHAVHEHTTLLLDYMTEYPCDMNALLLEGTKLSPDFLFSNIKDKIPPIPIIIIHDDKDRRTPNNDVCALYAYLSQYNQANVYLLSVGNRTKTEINRLVNGVLHTYKLLPQDAYYFSVHKDIKEAMQPEPDAACIKHLNQILEKENKLYWLNMGKYAAMGCIGLFLLYKIGGFLFR